MTEVKFCGLMNEQDVRAAVAAGARYVGMILTPGRRMITDAHAATLVACARGSLTVGVFGPEAPESIAERARAIGLDVAQLHGDPTAATIAQVRRHFAGAIWAAARVKEGVAPAHLDALFGGADTVVLDTLSTELGGSGVAFDWRRVAVAIAASRTGGSRLAIAGGLTARNVGEAIALLEPDIVDVCSGVERSPGVKDQAMLRDFAAAVDAASSAL
ncbi:MAG: phosphoribosylanthranilate isomerase [Gemmatimonadaceae bacterium]